MIKETKFKGYYVSDQGEVFSTWRGCPSGRVKVNRYLMSQATDDIGRKSVRLNNKNVRIHRLVYETFIGDIPNGKLVDHIDRNPSNNNLTNLRIASKFENQRNMNIRRDNKTGYKGVYFNKQRGHYQAYIQLKDTHKYLGSFATAEEASKAYDEAAIIYFKEFAATNKEIVK